MEHRHFSVTLVSANNLPNVRNFGSMSVYAKISLRNGQTPVADSEYQTSVDILHGTDPQWNDLVYKYQIKSSSLQEGNFILEIKLYCQRMLGDRYIGHVDVHLKTFFGSGSTNKLYTMPVLDENNAETQGKLQFLFAFEGVEHQEGKKDGQQSFLGAVAERISVALLAEGVKTVVLAMMGA